MTIAQRRGINATMTSGNACIVSAETTRAGPSGDATTSLTSTLISWVLGSELGHSTTRMLTAVPVDAQEVLQTALICVCETAENDATS